MSKLTPVKTDSRACYGIEFFATEKEAEAFSKIVRKRGDTYNGGYNDGAPCGRDIGHDHVDEAGVHFYAVTVA